MIKYHKMTITKDRTTVYKVKGVVPTREIEGTFEADDPRHQRALDAVKRMKVDMSKVPVFHMYAGDHWYRTNILAE